MPFEKGVKEYNTRYLGSNCHGEQYLVANLISLLGAFLPFAA